MAITVASLAQGISTTTIQGTVYLANGSAGSGTLQISWPAFTTAANLSVAAGRINANIGADGFVSVNLTPNLGASPAGLFYTAVYHMKDGTTSTEYCFLPGTDPDLVMRGTQPSMSFSRISAADHFYIRMYDAANPPNYSEFSAALIFNLPLNSGQ
jgi:hypothetical protein